MKKLLFKITSSAVGGAIVRAVPLLKTIKNATLGKDNGEKVTITTEWWIRLALQAAAVVGVLYLAKKFGVTPEYILDLLKSIITLGLA